MTAQHRNWRELAELVSKEHDSQRLSELVHELNAALDAEEALRRGPRPRSVHILFVDDESSIRATLPLALRAKGFEVTVAASIPEPLARMRASTFDVLLSDLNIAQPDDGFTLTRTMRHVDPHCVTIILTGFAGLDSAMQAVHRVDGYLAKPADLDYLAQMIEKLVSERRRTKAADSASR